MAPAFDALKACPSPIRARTGIREDRAHRFGETGHAAFSPAINLAPQPSGRSASRVTARRKPGSKPSFNEKPDN